MRFQGQRHVAFMLARRFFSFRQDKRLTAAAGALGRLIWREIRHSSTLLYKYSVRISNSDESEFVT
jgi:hypothetical protein